MSEILRDDDKVCAFVTTDSQVTVTAFYNWNGTADLSIGSLQDDGNLATADDCMEIGVWFIALAGNLRNQKLANDLKEISVEIEKA